MNVLYPKIHLHRRICGLEIYVGRSKTPGHRRIGGQQLKKRGVDTRQKNTYILAKVILRNILMPIYKFNRSTLNIPEKSGIYWVKAKNSASQTVLVEARYSHNIGRSIRLANKQSWLISGLSEYWVEVLLDEDIELIA
jgi:hypothetical protein